MTAKLPHATFSEPLELSLEGVRVDGVPRLDLLEGHLRRVDLAAVGEWRTVELDAVLQAPFDEVADFLDEGLELTCTLVVSSIATLLRHGARMQAVPDADGRWAATVALDVDDLRGKSEIVAQISSDLVGRRARRLGWSDPWDLYVDAAERPPFQGTFKVRWSHFTGASKEPTVPDAAASESFFLDLTGAVPAIHLNIDMEGLRELLEGDDKRPGLERALRGAEMRRIATAAWTAAIGLASAMTRVDPETGEHELPDSEWQAGVLRWSLPLIFPGEPLSEGLKRLRADLTGEQAAATQGMIQLAVASHTKAGELLQRALRNTGDE